MDKYIGKKLEGRYEILELIGIGGMANVYKALDVGENRAVAIKILREEFSSNEEFLRRFKNESKAIAMLSHPSIVKVYDVSFTDKIQMIVMELIDGITLKEYMNQEGPLKWKEALHFTVQILKALDHAHKKGIVHRDVKPQNIMLLADGTLRVMDFGIARFAKYESKTMTDKAIGSVHYISPEQAKGDNTDEKADIYSMGVMLFEMLTGQLPFDADSAVSIAIQQIQAQPKRPRDINPEIPEGLEEIVLKAMQKNPEERYQSAFEMLYDIEQFKINPSIHFEYKYMIASDKTDYSQDIVKARFREQPDGEDRRKKSSLVPILFGVMTGFCAMALGLLALLLHLNNPFEKVPEVYLPDLIGQRYEDVVRSPELQNIEIVVAETIPSETMEAGKITEQSPTGQRHVKVGSEIKVWVSSGPAQITVPDIYNHDLATAVNKLVNQGLEYEIVEQESETVTSGFVISTSPARTEPVKLGDTITLYVSKGTGETQVQVPNIVNLRVEDARRVLEGFGLRLGEQTRVDSPLAEGLIVTQTPGDNSLVDRGTAINVEVSYGYGVDPLQDSMTLAVNLPAHINDWVTIQVFVNNTLQLEQNVLPSIEQTWRPVIDGVGYVSVSVYINNTLYQEFMADFNTGTYVLELDNSGSF